MLDMNGMSCKQNLRRVLARTLGVSVDMSAGRVQQTVLRAGTSISKWEKERRP